MSIRGWSVLIDCVRRWYIIRRQSPCTAKANTGSCGRSSAWPPSSEATICILCRTVSLRQSSTRLMSLAVLLVKPPPCKRGLNALAMSFCLSVSLFVCRQKLSNLELWSLLTTNRKRRPIGSPTLAFQRTHSWRMTLSDSKPRPVLQRWRQGLPCRPMERYTCCKITNIFKHYKIRTCTTCFQKRLLLFSGFQTVWLRQNAYFNHVK